MNNEVLDKVYNKKSNIEKITFLRLSLLGGGGYCPRKSLYFNDRLCESSLQWVNKW